MTLGDIIKKYRSDHSMSMDDFSAKSGISKAYISLLEKNQHPKTGKEIAPSIQIIKQAAAGMKMDFDTLFNMFDGNVDLSSSYSEIGNLKTISVQKFPVLGEIACGKPILMNEQRELYVESGTEINADFCLIAKGDSMINARINDGDIIFIQKDCEIEDGRIYAVAIDDEATLKRVYLDQEKGIVQLVAENPKYKPLVYTNKDFENIVILGEAIAFQSDII